MRKITPIVSALALALSGGVFAQAQNGKIHKHESPATHRSCGTNDHHEFLKQTRPGYEKDFNEYNKMIDAYIKKENASTTKTAASITIPVVVHILYQNATENISDARAISQVAVLNEDFQKLNADTTIVPAIFKARATGVDVEFCLAQRDPSGNPTTGIVHKATTVATFSTNDAVKSSASGGDDAWDVTKYVNIWVCDLGSSLLGYGEFPTGSLSNTYGLVLNYRYTGRNGGAQAPFNLGRTGTHEFGHCFNLFHIWGDESACSGSDQCADTPNQKGENYGTPTYPQGTAATGGCCTAGDISSMYMNYMDYTDDAGMAMFSANQCSRILAVVNNAPWNVLQSSDGCTPVVLVSNDASVFAVTSPTGTTCNSSVTPVITLKNFGSAAMTSCTITYNIDGGVPSVYNWTGNLASLATAAVTLPSIAATAGTHTLTAIASSPNGSADGNATNDIGTTTFTVLGGTGTAMPFTEGFEGTTFVPTGWSLNNPDGNDTWERTTAAKRTGVASMRMDNYTTDYTGQRDEVTTPMIDLTSAMSPQMTFQLAYRLYTATTANPNYSDTLQILISSDCGATWTSIYQKFGAALTTTTPNFAANEFIPTTNAQWRMETISLASYSTVANAMFKFRNGSQYENHLYIDDINISGVVGVKEKDAVSLSVNVFPNPTNGLLNIEINNPTGSASEISVYNVIGEKVLNTAAVKGNYSTHTIDMSTLANGVYQLEVKADGKSSFKKIVVSK